MARILYRAAFAFGCVVWAGAGCAVLCVVNGCCDGSWSEAAISESVAIGRRIVGALEKHKARYEKYPKRLDDLTPEFRPSIPPPVAGNRVWEYGASRDQFSLTFRSSDRGQSYWYYSNAPAVGWAKSSGW